MELETFLRDFVEGALFMDLETMAAAKPTPAPGNPTPKFGYLGYPIIMACAAGIELLGTLLSDRYEEKSAKNFKAHDKDYKKYKKELGALPAAKVVAAPSAPMTGSAGTLVGVSGSPVAPITGSALPVTISTVMTTSSPSK